MRENSLNRVRLAVVGCGNITEECHLPAIVSEVPEIDLIAICNRGATRLNLLGDRYHIASAYRYTDYRALLDRSDIQAILVAASPRANYEIVLDAAKAGKHVFIEKPMAETVEQAREMVEAVERSGVRCQVGFNKRFYYGYQRAFKLIHEGKIDAATGIGARFWFSRSQRPTPARTQVVVQNGIHFLDLVQFFMGPATEVSAYEQLMEARATVTAILTFKSGAVGSILLSNFASWTYPNEWLDIVGSNGCCLSVENGRKVSLFVEGEPGFQLHFEQTMSGHWLSGYKAAGFAPQLQAFARSILTITPTAVGPTWHNPAGAQDGLRSLLLAEAIKRSLETRAPATLAEVGRFNGSPQTLARASSRGAF